MPVVIHNVPTNIISGFLGVGKTTAILDLFSKKAASEKWAVLVNEFGKTGIDGRIYQANNIAVKEIPGGCMCCAQGLPLQVAVNRLLAETRPDRLIIESSGVGHPAGVIKTLCGDGFSDALTMKAGICLIDPEHLLDSRYRNNELFQEQIQCADVLLANKTDLASVAALHCFEQLGSTLQADKARIATTINGQININWLGYNHRRNQTNTSFPFEQVLPAQHWKTHSIAYPDGTQFNLDDLKQCLDSLNILRLKGFLNTPKGFYLINCFSSQTRFTPAPAQDKSYIDAINIDIDVTALEAALSSCIIK